jgi:hypothetical protein
MQRWWRELQQQSNVGVSTNGSGTTEQAAVDSPKKTPWRTTTLDPASDGLYKPIRIQFDISDLLKQLETALLRKPYEYHSQTDYTDTMATTKFYLLLYEILPMTTMSWNDMDISARCQGSAE